MAVDYLTKGDFEIFCVELHSFFDRHHDPAPIFEQTDFRKLDMILSNPKMTWGAQDLYKSVYEKAACYFYFINKNHPFFNGNKRLSIVASMVFLLRNNYELTIDEEEMYAFAKSITISTKKNHHDLKRIAKYLEKHSKKIDSNLFLRHLKQINLKELLLNLLPMIFKNRKEV